MKQTAVEWLVKQLIEVERKNWINNKILSIGKNTLAKRTFDGIIDKAKEMEKEQIEGAYKSGWDAGDFGSDCWEEIYYNETFTNEK